MLYQKTLTRFIYMSSVQCVRRKANPGLGYQMLEFDSEDVSKDPEGLGDFESDFMQVHKSHKQYEREGEKLQERTRHWVVKNKYFNKKQPNFLTFAEKQQIKLLHSRDPEEWTSEKLAESFPASQEIIEKIIKASWVPRTEKRIREHDESVIQNWETLRNGGFSELNSVLREHIQKFASRSKEDLLQNTVDWNLRQELPKPKTDEFLSIITTCKKYAERSHPTALPKGTAALTTSNKFRKEPKNIPANANDKENETYLTDKVVDKRKMRLQELKLMKLTPEDMASSTQLLLEKAAANNCQNPSGTGTLSLLSKFDGVDEAFSKVQSTEVIVSEDDRKKYEMSAVKDQIYIPKKLRKKGATFKVEDCYYDDDGEFLYRVPGMTGRA